MTQTDVKMAWSRVGDKLSALGLKLKLHAEQEFADDDTEVKDALKRLADAFEDTANAIGNASTDKAVQRDVSEAGRRFVEAVSTTVNQAASGLKAKR